MQDYQERMDDLLSHCASMGVIDKQAIEIALTSYLPAHARSAYPPPWVCLESKLSCSRTSWFTFGQEADKYVELAYWRTKRPRYSRDFIYTLMTHHRSSNRLFVDSITPQWISHRHAVHELAPYLIRLQPKEGHPHLPSNNQIRELSRLFSLCTGLSHRDILPREWKPTEQLMDAMNLLTRLNPIYEGQWDRLYQSVSMVVSGHAALYGRDLSRDKPHPDDISAGGRVIRDSIGWIERKILDALTVKDGYMGMSAIKEQSGLRTAQITQPMYRLVGERVVDKKGRLYAASATIREFLTSPL